MRKSIRLLGWSILRWIFWCFSGVFRISGHIFNFLWCRVRRKLEPLVNFYRTAGIGRWPWVRAPKRRRALAADNHMRTRCVYFLGPTTN